MASTFDPEEVARFIATAHADRAEYRNVPPEMGLVTIADGYRAQDALAARLAAREGRVAGMKIATTTKVMQQLMGIDHPCAGLIFERRVHTSPARLPLSNYIHLVIECELAVRIGHPLPKDVTSYTPDMVRPCVAGVMAAFELIEDRNADYKTSEARSLIADNCWNAGVVLGPARPFRRDESLQGISGSLSINGKRAREGKTDDPLGAVAWVANVYAARGRLLEPGMVVITGSVVATLPIAAGETFEFEIEGVGSTRLEAL